MLWGGIISHGRTQLVIINGSYREDDRSTAHSSLHNSRAVTSRYNRTRDETGFLRERNIVDVAWPPVCSDLSPTEPVWGEMERRLRHV